MIKFSSIKSPSTKIPFSESGVNASGTHGRQGCAAVYDSLVGSRFGNIANPHGLNQQLWSALKGNSNHGYADGHVGMVMNPHQYFIRSEFKKWLPEGGWGYRPFRPFL